MNKDSVLPLGRSPCALDTPGQSAGPTLSEEPNRPISQVSSELEKPNGHKGLASVKPYLLMVTRTTCVVVFGRGVVFVARGVIFTVTAQRPALTPLTRVDHMTVHCRAVLVDATSSAFEGTLTPDLDNRVVILMVRPTLRVTTRGCAVADGAVVDGVPVGTLVDVDELPVSLVTGGELAVGV